MAENWKCPNPECDAFSHPRRKQCWKCDTMRADFLLSNDVKSKPTTRKSNRKSKSISTVAIIGLVSTCCSLFLAAFALIPGLWEMFFPKTLPETLLPTRTPTLTAVVTPALQIIDSSLGQSSDYIRVQVVLLNNLEQEVFANHVTFLWEAVCQVLCKSTGRVTGWAWSVFGRSASG